MVVLHLDQSIKYFFSGIRIKIMLYMSKQCFWKDVCGNNVTINGSSHFRQTGVLKCGFKFEDLDCTRVQNAR